ncbi:MAG: redoxin family protein [Armatimonadetes bacterium]|nr:redoxin family protein [Armatimonadota bacterium]
MSSAPVVQRSKSLALVSVGLAVLGVALAGSQQGPVRVAPERIAASEAGIGHRVQSLTAQAIGGESVSLFNSDEADGYVIALTDVSCPVCLRYAPTLAKLEDEYKDRGIEFVYLNTSSSDDKGDIQDAIRTHGFDGTYIWDPSGRVAGTLGAKTTTEVFLLDARQTVVYRGAVDDQYGIGYQNRSARKTYLSDAIDAMLAGERPEIEATTAPGCVLALDYQPMERKVTYHDQVSRILQRNCVTCHRDGGVAPFALDSYESADNFKGMIKFVVESGTMPPWFAAPMGDHSPWANDRTLAEQDKAELMSWIEDGSPEGDPDDAPVPLVFDDTWAIGEPDVIIEIPEEIAVQATGQMDYIYKIAMTDFDGDRWIKAMEIVPTDRAVVHHVLVFLVDDDQAARRKPLRLNGNSGFFMGYVPGTNSVVFPEGFAKMLPKGMNLLFQLHYTPNGIATKDQTRIGMKFTDEAPKNEVFVQGIANTRFRIPPGAANHSDTSTIVVPADIVVTNYLAHMHLRGKAFKFEVEYPDGSTEVLLDIPRYDFNWQLTYKYSEPKLIPKGSKITVTGTFDNSADNPANPDPTKTVRWGDQTDEEMLLGYFEYYVPGGAPGEKLEFGRSRTRSS